MADMRRKATARVSRNEEPPPLADSGMASEERWRTFRPVGDQGLKLTQRGHRPLLGSMSRKELETVIFVTTQRQPPSFTALA